jgi:hypothetical protein
VSLKACLDCGETTNKEWALHCSRCGKPYITQTSGCGQAFEQQRCMEDCPVDLCETRDKNMLAKLSDSGLGEAF